MYNEFILYDATLSTSFALLYVERAIMVLRNVSGGKKFHRCGLWLLQHILRNIVDVLCSQLLVPALYTPLNLGILQDSICVRTVYFMIVPGQNLFTLKFRVAVVATK